MPLYLDVKTTGSFVRHPLIDGKFGGIPLDDAARLARDDARKDRAGRDFVLRILISDDEA